MQFEANASEFRENFEANASEFRENFEANASEFRENFEDCFLGTGISKPIVTTSSMQSVNATGVVTIMRGIMFSIHDSPTTTSNK